MLTLLLASLAFAGPNPDRPSDPPVTVDRATSSRSVLLPWSAVGFQPAAPEQPASGPEGVAVGPDGLVALRDPVRDRVIVLRDLKIVADFPAPHLDDLAFAGDDLALLQGRTIRLVAADGAPLAEAPVPDLAPTALWLRVEGDTLFGDDAFGNRRPLARRDGDRLLPPSGPSVLPPTHEVTSHASAGVVRVGSETIQVGAAPKMSARDVGGGWILVERVTASSPLTVERVAIDRTGRHDRVTIPLQGRLYAPVDDVGGGADGRLVYAVPTAEGLRVTEVSR